MEDCTHQEERFITEKGAEKCFGCGSVLRTKEEVAVTQKSMLASIEMRMDHEEGRLKTCDGLQAVFIRENLQVLEERARFLRDRIRRIESKHGF